MLGMAIRSRTLQVEACSVFPSQTDSHHIMKSTARVRDTGHGQLTLCQYPGRRHISKLLSVCSRRVPTVGFCQVVCFSNVTIHT